MRNFPIYYEDEDDFQEQPPQKRERSRSVKRVLKMDPMEKWTKKEEEKPTKAPARSQSAHMPSPRPQFQAALVFEHNRQYNRHNYIWYGDTTNAPNWTKSPASANQIGNLTINFIPAIHKSRNIQHAQFRQIPLDGANHIQDIAIQPKKDDKNIIIISSMAKERGESSEKTQMKEIEIPQKDWSAFTTALRESEFTELPAAIEDVVAADPNIHTCKVKGGKFEYSITAKHTSGNSGNERKLHIRQCDEKTRVNNSIELPWRFTTLFRVKFEIVQYEIEVRHGQKL